MHEQLSAVAYISFRTFESFRDMKTVLSHRYSRGIGLVASALRQGSPAPISTTTKAVRLEVRAGGAGAARCRRGGRGRQTWELISLAAAEARPSWSAKDSLRLLLRMCFSTKCSLATKSMSLPAGDSSSALNTSLCACQVGPHGGAHSCRAGQGSGHARRPHRLVADDPVLISSHVILRSCACGCMFTVYQQLRTLRCALHRCNVLYTINEHNKCFC